MEYRLLHIPILNPRTHHEISLKQKNSISTTLEISTPKSPQFNVFNRLILSNSTMTLNPLSKTCQLDTECEIDYVEGVKLLTLENPPLTIGSVTKADTL